VTGAKFMVSVVTGFSVGRLKMMMVATHQQVDTMPQG
jgi:hypothetical protein